MSEDNDNRFKVRATMFSREYGIGYNPVFSLRATRLSSGRYLIESKSGNGPVELAEGEPFLNKGHITVNINGDLNVGDITIPVGHNLIYGVTAEPKDENKTKFALFTKGAAKKFYKQVELGDIDESSGLPWEVDQYGNLTNSGRSVKVLPQLNTRNLVIKGPLTQEESAELGLKDAFFANFEYKDLIDDVTHTSRGYYVRNPMKGTIGEFKEYYQGELVTTAKVRMYQNSFSISMRTPEDAYISNMEYQEKRELERQIASLNDPLFIKKNKSDIGQDSIDAIKSELSEQLAAVSLRVDESKKKWLQSMRFLAQNEGRELLVGKSGPENNHSEPTP